MSPTDRVSSAFRWEGPGSMPGPRLEGFWYGYNPGDEVVVELGVYPPAPWPRSRCTMAKTSSASSNLAAGVSA